MSAATYAQETIARMRAAAASAEARRGAVWDCMPEYRRMVVLRVAYLDQSLASLSWAQLPEGAHDDIQAAVLELVGIVRGLSFKVPA
jgi:hypothetical protein